MGTERRIPDPARGGLTRFAGRVPSALLDSPTSTVGDLLRVYKADPVLALIEAIVVKKYGLLRIVDAGTLFAGGKRWRGDGLQSA